VARRALERQLRPALLADLGDRPAPDAVHEAAAEVAARGELLELLADLERLAVPLPSRAGAPGPGDLVARVEEEVRAADLRPRDPRRLVLHAVDAREARAWEADLVLVLGLTERDLPRALHDDLYIPEGARRALGGGRRAGGRLRLELRTAQDRAAEELFLFWSAATRARRELWLCWPGFGPGGAPLQPSRHLDAVRAAVGERAWEQACVLRGPAQLVPDEPAEVLTPDAARRFAWRRVTSVARPDGPAAGKVRLALALFAALVGREGERRRASRALRGSEPTLRGPLGARLALERVYSATELEAYAACPFRHFVQFVLGIRPRDDLALSGLDARRQGMLVHEALERIYARGEAPEAALEAAFARAARELDIGLAEEALRRQAAATVRAFVGQDDPAFRAATGLVPHAFEQQFGPRIAGREGRAAGALVIPAPALGGEIQVRGAIDRIDLLPPGPGAPGAAPRGFVTDYKLGGREVDADYLDGMHKGENLQVPLYLLALERVFGLRAVGATFAALGTRRRTGVIDVEAPPWERTLAQDPRVRLHRLPLAPLLQRTEEQVRRIVGGIAAGIIDPLPRDAGECDRCDVRDVCRLDGWEARRRARNGRALPLERLPRGLPVAAP
jgi:ATP-dependent helicase/nuclease subunit B